MPEETIVVTGGAGFIGSFLVEMLLKNGKKIRVPYLHNKRTLENRKDIEWRQGDLEDRVFCRELMNGATQLYHLAACRRNIAFHLQERDTVIRKNTAIDKALIDACGAGTRVILMSTALLATMDDDLSSADGYIASKAQGEELWHQASVQKGLPLLIVRASHTYGPRDRFLEHATIIPSLIHRAMQSTDTLTVWGTGKRKLQLLYVEDLALAITLFDPHAEGLEYIAPPLQCSVGEVAKEICTLVNPALKIVFDPSHPEGDTLPIVRTMHPGLIAMEWTPLHTGLERTVAWWKAQCLSSSL